MDPKFQSSFIPKGPVSASTSTSITRPGQKNVFAFLAKIVFVLALVLALGVFGYQRYLLSSIGTMGDALTNARAKLEPDTIQQVIRLDERIVSTQSLIDSHTILSPLFDLLENSTLKSVRWTDFIFGKGEKGITLSMHGQARGYSSLALQSDTFNHSKFLKSPMFSDLDLDNSGNVIFSFNVTLDPSLIAYKRAIENPTATSFAPSTPVATSTASSTKSK